MERATSEVSHVLPSAYAHGIQPAGRRQPHFSPAGQDPGHGHGALRRHGSRRDVRRGRILSAGEEPGHPPGHRMRGLRLPRHA